MAATLSKRLTVLIRPEMHDWLREQAAAEQLEVSDIARRALRLYRESTPRERDQAVDQLLDRHQRLDRARPRQLGASNPTPHDTR